MMATKPFKGTNVFMSRNLVPPEVFDSLHDLLKLNGAEVLLCCDPSRNGPNDFHVISSSDHEKFEDLRAKGCNLLGPPCVFSCAKERRAFPKQGFSCCLAMDGVKVLPSGFDAGERAKIAKLVTAMGGILHTKASPDISFIIVKDVSAAKYKWAIHVKKPLVTINWLYQCWNEHRTVPQESFRVPPFLGLIICVTRIPADERKEMEKLIVQNGGKYSAELTRTCTHLICNAAEGDKFKVARKWGHIRIVTRKWFDQSIAMRVCLDEEAYPVQGSLSSVKQARDHLTAKQSQDKSFGHSQSIPSLTAVDSNIKGVPSVGIANFDLEATLSQNISSAISDVPVIFSKEKGGEEPVLPKSDAELDRCVADDSQNEDNDLYLSDCKIGLVGFDASNMRKLVRMVHKGGGSRYMTCSERLTHIVVGSPSDVEMKGLRGLAALGVIHVVRPLWLEDCDREKREVPIMQRHIAYDILLSKGGKDLVDSSNKRSAISMTGVSRGKCTTMPSSMSVGPATETLLFDTGIVLRTSGERKLEMKMDNSYSMGGSDRISQRGLLSVSNNEHKSQQQTQGRYRLQAVEFEKSDVFWGKFFHFSNNFPDDRRDEVIQWIHQGGGGVVQDHCNENVDFTVECHGVMPPTSSTSQTTYVSSHWIRSCLEDGCVLDVHSHVLYSPLTCPIPLPGFEGLRFCVSQYEEKDRLLLRNLCFVLGSKFGEKLTKKVTHLLCKFATGIKYEAACKWGIQPVTSEWIYECIRKSTIVSPNMFSPKEVSSEDRGLGVVSQYPTQAAQMASGDELSERSSKSLDFTRSQVEFANNKANSDGEDAKRLIYTSKRLRLMNNDNTVDVKVIQPGCRLDDYVNVNCTENRLHDDSNENRHAVPDVAAAIEDLLEQTSKIRDVKSPERTDCEKTIFTSDCPVLGRGHTDSHSAYGSSRSWLSRLESKDESSNPTGDKNATVHDGFFSETQTDSQMVGYEEDLSGRQMIIDRVRTRSSMT